MSHTATGDDRPDASQGPESQPVTVLGYCMQYLLHCCAPPVLRARASVVSRPCSPSPS